MLDKLDEEGSEYLAGLRDRYYLEVSSPGIERPLFSLEHYKRFEGRDAKIKLAEPLDGRKNLTGKIILADIENKIIKIYIYYSQKCKLNLKSSRKGSNYHLLL